MWAKGSAFPHHCKEILQTYILKKNQNIFTIILNLSKNFVYKFVWHGWLFCSWQTVCHVLRVWESQTLVWFSVPEFIDFLLLPCKSDLSFPINYHLAKWPSQQGLLEPPSSQVGDTFWSLFFFFFTFWSLKGAVSPLQTLAVAWNSGNCIVMGHPFQNDYSSYFQYCFLQNKSLAQVTLLESLPCIELSNK